MTKQEIIDACLPCRHCGEKCFAKWQECYIHHDDDGTQHMSDVMGKDADDASYDGIEHGDPSWPDKGEVVRISTMCDEADEAIDTGWKDDQRTSFGMPEQAVAEWNERFGIIKGV